MPTARLAPGCVQTGCPQPPLCWVRRTAVLLILLDVLEIEAQILTGIEVPHGHSLGGSGLRSSCPQEDVGLPRRVQQCPFSLPPHLLCWRKRGLWLAMLLHLCTDWVKILAPLKSMVTFPLVSAGSEFHPRASSLIPHRAKGCTREAAACTEQGTSFAAVRPAADSRVVVWGG